MLSRTLGDVVMFSRWTRRLLLSVITVLCIILTVTLINILFLKRELTDDDEVDKVLKSDNSPSTLPWHGYDVKSRVQEMIRIRKSVGEELRDMEERWQVLTKELSEGPDKKRALKSDIFRLQQEVERTRSLLDQLELIRRDASLRQNSPNWRPLPPAGIEPAYDGSGFSMTSFKYSGQSCSMQSCFDYSRCPLSSTFSVYLHETAIFNDSSINDYHIKSFLHKLRVGKVVQIASDPLQACLFLVMLPPAVNFDLLLHSKSSTLKSLWNHGRNHLIVNLFHPHRDILTHLKTEQAMLAQMVFDKNSFRRDFDVVFHVADTNISFEEGLLCPARRRFLASSQFSVQALPETNKRLNQVITILKKLQRQASEAFQFRFSINNSSPKSTSSSATSAASKPSLDIELLKQSTFFLITETDSVPGLHHNESSSRLLEYCLRSSSIPIIIGYGKSLPFSEVIDWTKASIILPPERLPELYLILKSVSDVDILELRRWGRIFYSRYLEDITSNFLSLMSLIRQKRLMIPAQVIPEAKSQSFYNSFNTMKQFNSTDDDTEDGASREFNEFVGPVEPLFPSESFTRNLTRVLTSGYEMWNTLNYDPFYSYPHSPFDPVAPAEAKFLGSEYGFRPIAGGDGAAGPEFSHSLGGNVVREQFTIVMLTYERESVLIDTLTRLKGVPYLNKVLVVWNHPTKRPDPALMWPNIGVAIKVILAEKNSLNNRFLPFDEIETEAILSLDDDTQLRHDEIVFGFRQVMFFPLCTSCLHPVCIIPDFFGSERRNFLLLLMLASAKWIVTAILMTSYAIFSLFLLVFLRLQGLERSKRANRRISGQIPLLGSNAQQLVL